MGLPRAEVARRLGVSRTLFYRILAGGAAATPAVALRLGRLFDTSAEMWLGLQRDYDLAVDARATAFASGDSSPRQP